MPRQLRYTENQKELFAPGMPMRTAANMLLSHIKGSRDARGAWTEQRGTHQWPAIVQKVCSLRDSSTFLSHRVVTTTDTRQGEACTITVHQFIIHPGVAEDINPALRVCGAKKYAGACGIMRSNQGGFHSDSVSFPLKADAADAWYRGVHDLVLEAIKVIEPTWRDAEVYGWLNASGKYDFNCLHDHGSRDGWSAVYYAASGADMAPSRPRPAADVPVSTAALSLALLRGGAPNSELLMAKSIADLRAIAARHGISLLAAEGDLRETSALSAEAALAGALLLQTRPEPTTLAYSVLPIAPVPGELWLFPLHVTHAVMPRAMPSPEGTPGPLGGSLRPSPPPGGHLRISVACNIYEHEAQGAESEAQR